MTLDGKIISRFLMVIGFTLSFGAASAETTCYGEGSYRVCTTTTFDADGNLNVRSTDSMGNSYSMETDSYTTPSGRNVVRSQDSMGNSYKVESWSDERGYHSRDSEGNVCTITHDGRMIGCD